MRTDAMRWVVAAVMVGALMAQQGLAEVVAVGGEKGKEAGAELYRDEAAGATASVTQVFGNGQPTTQTFGSVERIAIQQDVFVVHWGKGAVTLLPRQFVVSITINKRMAEAATTSPGR